MFTAIVTAMLGVTYLALDGRRSTSRSSTSSRRTGWRRSWAACSSASASWSAATARARRIVSTATGKLDGLVFVLGFAAGTLGFAVAFPLVKGLYLAGDAGTKTLPQITGLPYGAVVLAVVLMAVGGFAGATWVEGWMARRDRPRRERSRRRRWHAGCRT